MATRKGESVPSAVEAVQTVYSALENLDADTRQKVLASVTALLGMETEVTARQPPRIVEESRIAPQSRPIQSDRPKSLVEVIQEKHPSTNDEKIALFAYYRERIEGLSRFSRGDLKQYFAVAKEKPAANYDRDFSKAIKAGWIHEDGSDSYLTSRGLEAVESGFSGGSGEPRRNPKKSSKAGKRSPRKR